MDNKQLIKVLGNPRAVTEYNLYRYFEQKDRETYLSYLDSLFMYGVAKDVGNLTDEERYLLAKLQKGTHNRIERIIEILVPKSGEIILDGGCGVGPISYRAIRMGALVYSFDMNINVIRDGRDIINNKAMKIRATCANALYIPFVDALFDKVVFADVFEHINDKMALLMECYRVLREGGKLFLHTDNAIRVILGVLVRRLQYVCTFRNPLKWNAAWSGKEGGHTGLITANKAYSLLRKIGFKRIKIIFDASYPLGLHRVFSGAYTIVGTK